MKHKIACLVCSIILFVMCSYSAFSAGKPKISVFAPDVLYPDPVGDSRYPVFSLTFPFMISQFIDSQEDNRWSARESLSFGGAISLIRIEGPISSAQLSVGAGLFTQFDSFADGLDNFAWEGTGFLTIDASLGKYVSVRAGFHHLSSHIGDEYLARYDVVDLPLTSAEQMGIGDGYGLDYVRDSLLFALSYHPEESINIYLESRYSMNMLLYMLRYNDYPWQIVTGFDKQWKAWFLGASASMYQETSWFPSLTLQTGRQLEILPQHSRVRLGIEYYYGRPSFGVFNYTRTALPWKEIRTEQYISIGFWYEI